MCAYTFVYAHINVDLSYVLFICNKDTCSAFCVYASLRVIGGGTAAGTDCRESPTTCSISGFCYLGKPPYIYTLAWLAEQPALLMRDPLV